MKSLLGKLLWQQFVSWTTDTQQTLWSGLNRLAVACLAWPRLRKQVSSSQTTWVLFAVTVRHAGAKFMMVQWRREWQKWMSITPGAFKMLFMPRETKSDWFHGSAFLGAYTANCGTALKLNRFYFCKTVCRQSFSSSAYLQHHSQA